MSPDADVELLVQAGRRLAGGGLSPGSSGNLSVRSGDAVLVTRRGADLAALAPADLVRVDLGGPQDPTTRPVPTKELGMHAAVYRARPEATAVVHVHSHHATAVACLPGDAGGLAPLPLYTPYRVMRLGRVPLVPFAPPGSDALAAAVGAAAADAHVLLLAHHGALVAAADMDEAVADAFELEAAARLTLQLAGTGAVELDPSGWGSLRP